MGAHFITGGHKWDSQSSAAMGTALGIQASRMRTPGSNVSMEQKYGGPPLLLATGGERIASSRLVTGLLCVETDNREGKPVFLS